MDPLLWGALLLWAHGPVLWIGGLVGTTLLACGATCAFHVLRSWATTARRAISGSVTMGVVMDHLRPGAIAGPNGGTVIMFRDRRGVLRRTATVTPAWPYRVGQAVTVRYDPTHIDRVDIVVPLGFDFAFALGCLAVGAAITAVTWQAHVVLSSF